MNNIRYEISLPVNNASLNQLFASAWDKHTERDFQRQLQHSLDWICAYTDDEQLVGFVNLAWDGGVHAFLLDTTVHRDFQRQGIGVALVKRAIDHARTQGIEWVHVDYEPHLDGFYKGCGFTPTLAGLVNLA